MGKDKRKRNKPHRENPTGLVSVNHFDEEENSIDVDKEEALRRVYEEIQSSVIEEKLSGLQTLESMSYDKDMAERISTEGIAKMIGPLLIDHSIIVRASVASALRHIAENGGDKAVTKLINDDIMTSLSTLFIRDYKEWQPKLDPIDKEKLRDEKETFTEAVMLLLTLCENNEMAVKHVNKHELLSILLQYLNFTTYGIEMCIVVSQCILTLSEDNPIATETLANYKQSLLNILNLQVCDDILFCDLMLLKTLVIGILLNMNCFTQSNEIHVFNQVTKILLEILDIDNNNLSNDLSTILSMENEKLSKESQKKIRDFRKLLNAQQQALEILTNLCADEDENIFPFELYDSDVMNQEDLIYKNKPEENNTSNDISSLPLEMIEIITNSNVIKKVWTKTKDIDNVIRECFSNNIEGRTLLKQIHVLRCRAYLCTHNLLLIVHFSTTNDVEDLYNIWCQTGTFVFKDADPNDYELLDSATAVLRACLQLLVKLKANYFSSLTVDDIKPMLQLNKLCSNENVGINIIRILGNLALLIAETDNQQKHDLMKHISVFLLVTCKNEFSAWINAECLDSLMDLFSNDETDQLAKEIQLTVKLSELVPIFKQKVRQQKDHLIDKHEIISTVIENIIPFIKYKEKRLQLSN